MRAKDTFRNCDFIPYQTSNLRARWPQISRKNARHGLQAVLLDGEVIKNETAVAACLMQLKGYRWLARIIISPFIQPMASSIYRLIASKRR